MHNKSTEVDGTLAESSSWAKRFCQKHVVSRNLLSALKEKTRSRFRFYRVFWENHLVLVVKILRQIARWRIRIKNTPRQPSSNFKRLRVCVQNYEPKITSFCQITGKTIFLKVASEVELSFVDQTKRRSILSCDDFSIKIDWLNLFFSKFERAIDVSLITILVFVWTDLSYQCIINETIFRSSATLIF